MKTHHPKKKTLTFGQFVASTYASFGKQRARAKIERAVNARLVQFLGRQRFVVS